MMGISPNQSKNRLRAIETRRQLMDGTRELSRGTSFWVAAAVIVHTLWTSAAPAMTYPLYAAQWHLTHTVTTAIFAVYPIAVVLALLVFGNLSDHIGRRTAILLGLAASLIGVLLFALAQGVAWVFVGRAFMGMGVGLSTSPATAAMIEYSGANGSQRASFVTTAATGVGFALATVVGGALIEYAPAPMHLTFWVLFVVLAALFGAAWFLPRPQQGITAVRWRPGDLAVPRAILLAFFTAAFAVTAGYTHGAVLLSIGAQMARDLIGSSNMLVNGAAIALFAVVGSIVSLFAKKFPSVPSVAIGGLLTIVDMGMLMLSASHHSLVLFMIAVTIAGAAYSLLVLGGLGLINAKAPTDRRAATLSAVYVIAYLMMGIVSLSLGAAATAWGLESGVDLGSSAVALFGLIATLLALSGGGLRALLPFRKSPLRDCSSAT
jgi:predicted MFS family arabinose efflux permease